MRGDFGLLFGILNLAAHQSDQIWLNFTALAIFLNSLAFFHGFIWYLVNNLNLIWPICCTIGQTCIVFNGQIF